MCLASYGHCQEAAQWARVTSRGHRDNHHNTGCHAVSHPGAVLPDNTKCTHIISLQRRCDIGGWRSVERRGWGAGATSGAGARSRRGASSWRSPPWSPGPGGETETFVTTAFWHFAPDCPMSSSVCNVSARLKHCRNVQGENNIYLNVFAKFVFYLLYRCGLSICDECSAPEMNRNIDINLQGLTPHSVECRFLTSHGVILNRKRNKTEAKLLQPLVTVLRLLLTNGWSELEGNVIKRKGTRSWNFTEKNIIPHLQNIRDFNNNNIFSKVRSWLTTYKYKYIVDFLRKTYTSLQEFLTQIVLISNVTKKWEP